MFASLFKRVTHARQLFFYTAIVFGWIGFHQHASAETVLDPRTPEDRFACDHQPVEVLVSTAAAPAKLPFAQGDTVLFLGDSITQGGSYIDLIQTYLWAKHPDLNLHLINLGLSSETVSGITEPVHPYPRPNIHDRLDRALRIAKPDWVFVCYGMNDGIYHPIEPRIEQAYRDGLEKLLQRIAAVDAKVILLTPPTFDVDTPKIRKAIAAAAADEPYGYRKPYERYNETLGHLSTIVKSFAETAPVERVIDLHVDTDAYVAAAHQQQADYAYGDGVHPPEDGHLVMALAVLKGLGVNGDEARQTLAQRTGIRPLPFTSEQLPEGPEADATWKAIHQRGSELSAAYRKAVADQAPIEQHREALQALEKRLRVKQEWLGKSSQ